jgi:hypothetical protein
MFPEDIPDVAETLFKVVDDLLSADAIFVVCDEDKSTLDEILCSAVSSAVG